MLVTEDKNFVENFVALFLKKFRNFANKAPVLISFDNLTIEGVFIQEKGTNKSLNYKFDHTKSVKQNIKEIKDWLVENTYPIMIQEKKYYEDYTTEELEKIISESSIIPEQAVCLKKEIHETIKWRINKILVKKDELFITNLNTDKQYRFKLSMPSTILLRNLRDKWTPTYAFQMFQQKSEMLNEIYFTPEVDEE
jgi:hypothetical protein